MALDQNSALPFVSAGVVKQDRASSHHPAVGRRGHPSPAGTSISCAYGTDVSGTELGPGCQQASPDGAPFQEHEELGRATDRTGSSRGARLHHPCGLHPVAPRPLGMDSRSSCSKRRGLPEPFSQCPPPMPSPTHTCPRSTHWPCSGPRLPITPRLSCGGPSGEQSRCPADGTMRGAG